MQFIFPSFFWALSLLAIPVIIHLLNFRRYKTVFFSNVGFLFNIQQEKKSRSTLRNLLILLMRLLIVTGLIFAFSRPFIPNDNHEKSLLSGVVVIYIDNSFSMEAEGKFGILLEQAKLRAIEIADAFPPSTQFKLITNNFDLRYSNPVNKAQFKELVSLVQVSSISRTLNDVIERKQSTTNQADSLSSDWFFLLSDFQESTCFKTPLYINKNDNFVLAPFVPQNITNLSIDSLWFSTPGIYLNKLEELNVNITNHSTEVYQNLSLSLFINNVQKTVANFNLEPNQTKTVKIPYLQNTRGKVLSRVEIADYPVTFDNSFYFNYEIKNKIKILDIYQNKPSPYLKAIFASDSNFIYQNSSVFTILPESIATFDLVLISNLSEISSGINRTLSQYINNGGNVVLLPSDKSMLTSYNAFLNECKGPTFISFINQKGSTTQLDLKHPIFNGTFGNQDFSKVKLPEYTGYFHLKLPSNTSAAVILETELGDPFYTITHFGTGTLSVLSVPLDATYSNFVTHPLALPLFYNTALQSTNNDQLYYELKPGITAKVNVPADVNANVELKSTDGKYSTIPDKKLGQGDLWLYPEAENLTSGHVNLYANGTEFSSLSFNYNSTESKLGFIDENGIMDKFKKAGAKRVQILSNNTKTTAIDIEKMERGVDLTYIFILLVLLFLLAEIVLIKSK